MKNAAHKNAEQARKNLVECQLMTTGVTSAPVLAAYEAIPREMFVPPGLQGAAYLDEDLPLGDGTFLMEPSLQARLFQSAEVGNTDIVLNIGDAGGYSSALLSTMAMTVVALEGRAGQLDRARRAWTDLSCCNIAVIGGSPCAGCPEHAPYSLIVLNGAVAEIPQCILDQLAPGGRLAAVLNRGGLGRPSMGQAVLVKRLGSGSYDHRILFDAATPFIPGFEPRPAFVFGT